MIEDVRLLKIVARHDPVLLLIINPQEWAELIVELGKRGEVEVAKIACCKEVACDAEWLQGFKTLDARLHIWRFADETVELAISIVSRVDGLEWI